MESLNVSLIKSRMQELGFSQRALSKQISLSVETLSQWLSGDNFPHPKNLLQLGKALKLSYGELVLSNPAFEPVVAFRKRGNSITSNQHIKHAQEIGKALECLASHLPFDNLSRPPSFVAPKAEYHYVQAAAQEVRRHLKIEGAIFPFEHLIDFFSQLHAVVIPVLWGEKQKHENALHIYLPKSRTTWVLLNLDTFTHDFKFWMAHELGHAKAPELIGNEAEDFSDMFAGTLLFPESEAKETYESLCKLSSVGSQINYIKDVATKFEISPITVWIQVEAYFKAYNFKEIKLSKSIYAAAANLNKKYKLVSHSLLGEKPTSEKYITITKEVFKSPFFDAVRAHFNDQQQVAAFLSQALNISGLDAQDLCEELMRATN